MRLITEDIEPQTKKIASLTGTRPDAVKHFVSAHALNITKLLKFVEKGKLSDRMDLVSAIAGKPGNPIQKKMIKMFSESVTEGKKRFNTKYGVGKAKYVVNYHDGKKKHKDGSDFFDIQIFKNQKDLDTFKKALLQKGFIEESVNESMKLSDMVSITDKLFELVVLESFADPLEGFPQAYKDLLKKLQRSNDRGERHMLINKMNVIRKKLKLKPLTNESVNEAKELKWQDVEVGDAANVKAINKTGLIIKTYGRKFHLKFANGSTKTYDANDLTFIKNESVTEAKFGYKDSTASYINKHNNEYKIAEKLNKGNEMKFYDDLQKMEDKIGHPKFMIFVSNALRGYGVDMYKDPKIKNPQDAQEALFLLSK